MPSVEDLFTKLVGAYARIAELEAKVEAQAREIHRLASGDTIEGDGICEHEVRVAELEAARGESDAE